MILVELFSKEDCHLCQEAKTVLEKVRHDIPFELKERKLTPSDPFYDRFSEKVPVLFINGEEVFHFRINERMLQRKLREFRE